jgi:hypothetical protein
MKKNILSLIAMTMFSSFCFANTIEMEETQKTIGETTFIHDKSEDALRICYETSRSSVAITEYITQVTVTYTCFNHPEMPGKGTVYIDN